MEGLNRPISPCQLPTLFENDIVSSVRAHETFNGIEIFSQGVIFLLTATGDVPLKPRR